MSDLRMILLGIVLLFKIEMPGQEVRKKYIIPFMFLFIDILLRIT